MHIVQELLLIFVIFFIISTCEKTKDCENNVEKVKETYIFKSDEPRFLDFPEKFEDWSEDQKKDAYDNFFKLYLEKSLKPYSFGSLPLMKFGSLPQWIL
mgnify:CR=1 FL=1